MEVPNDLSAEKSTRNQKSQSVNQKSQPVNQNAEKSTRTQKKCDRVALSGKIPLSGTFHVPKSPLRGKNNSWGKNGSCAITAQREPVRGMCRTQSSQVKKKNTSRKCR
ncbi:hypothetical protein LR48_Vigan07g166400 [Vigna angularis]|uniref:Uncharacterized protein n=1 Tax=Phaseolus angularis TaxID=3914 RepID=A0A0L9UYQ1_PHAAN|nr:hypothetical protein LR48_Vigan07g166400 [Vigna angularis]